MSFRWSKSIRLFRNFRLNHSLNGLGWSWGFSILRYGVSADGKRWVSIGIQGTGLRYYKSFKQSKYKNNSNSNASNNKNRDRDNPRNSKITKWDNLR
ncbi:DUF4236 domain-containing protein [uncultured Pseudoalteromonas sp.]|uniref:DUF4236 domain-containing protein n=1 Tax=uncultured Pseudoalteromonas sp. TaxID=114053 RepID=UPI00259A0AD3|nr:DUF4236 domain-containing protein [uncultured Pseudoalteromonas sp.]